MAKSEQVIKDLDRVIGLINTDMKDIPAEEKKQMVADTIDHFDNYVSPGWLKYRKSVSSDSEQGAVLEWQDEGAYCYGLNGEKFIDCLGGFGIYTCGHRNPEILKTVKAQLDHQALHSQELLDPLRGYLAKALADITPGDLQYCFFTNGGAEAVEMALRRPEDTRYCLGSVLNHVVLHQTVIGQEAVKQMEMADAEPDMVIGCFGGGSNFAGIGFPFLQKNLTEGKKIRVIAVEPEGCPKLTRGEFQYDFGDVAGFTPLLPMYTLGHDFQPSDIHAGGLRYHGAGSIVSQLMKDGLIEAQAMPQVETLAAGVLFAQTEGIIPAPESTHAIAATIREALKAKEEGVSKTILFNLSGNGVIDLYAYEQYLAGALKDFSPSDEEIAKTVNQLEHLI